MPQNSYLQPEKQRVPQKMRKRAINTLTSERPSMPLVHPDELAEHLLRQVW